MTYSQGTVDSITAHGNELSRLTQRLALLEQRVDRREFLELRRAGWTLREIATRMGRSYAWALKANKEWA